MKTINQTFTNEIIIEKSKFIGIIKPLNNKDDVKNILNEIKKKYPKATHYCYGYIVNGLQKSNDDGEPSSTAGKPILETLLKNDLFNVILIVVRYFGGIKLGAGGLTRAYVDSASQTIKKSILLTKKEVEIYKINTSYELNDVLNRYLIKKSIIVIDVQYLENIEYTISCEKLDIDDLKNYMQGKIEISFLRKENILVK
ncbi:putative YigZ family protein [Firmicutes bacterium CAG:449]|nr:putative YigZ family protein [Firmicutes bacterium CAG:449]